MSRIDIPTPPSKKRKVTTTYGSRNGLSRAFLAVKDLVSTKSASLGNKDLGDSSLLTEVSKAYTDALVSPERINGLQVTAHLEDRANGLNDAIGTRTDEPNHASQGQHSGRRISKRIGDKVEVPDGTPSRKKRRKYKTEVEGAHFNEIQASEKEVYPAISGSSPGKEITQQSRNYQEASKGDAAIIDGATPLINGGHSYGRPRRRPRRPSLELEDKSPVRSTPRKTQTPNTPTSTPSRKRGRPRKHIKSTPKSHDAEERELGFREIGTQDRPDVRGNQLQRGSGNTAGKQMNSKGRSPSLSGEDTADPLDADGVSNIKSDAVQRRHTLRASSLEPDAVRRLLQVQDDDSHESHKYLDVPEPVRKAMNKLRRSLEISSTQSVHLLKSSLLRGLTERRPLVNMDEEYRKVQQLVSQTVLAGEGNSMLVIGPRGCGKTALVETVLSDLAIDHDDEFIVIRLNGFFHTDDKLALREVWRQLGREVADDEEREGVRVNYANTLTSLLALLAHSPEEEGKVDEITRSVVFIIDEIDLFASHPRQTLLYNLFDVAQSRNAPIAVLGLTTRTDIVESLEKRVKSRFGQRYVNLAHPRTFISFQDICRSALTSPKSTDTKLFDDLRSEKEQVSNCREAWNGYVDALFAHDRQFEIFLRHLFARSKCIPTFLSACCLPLRLLSSSGVPTGMSFVEQSLLPSDSKLQFLLSLSDLELSLLIAAARLDIILDTDVCNFSMVYEEYVQLASRVKAQSSAAGQTAVGGGARVWGKEPALGAWEKLVELELVLPVSRGSNSNGSRGMYRVDVALEEIGTSCPRMGATMSKWCREI